MSERYVYRLPWETPARTLTSGNQNIVPVGLGVVPALAPARACPAWGCGEPPFWGGWDRPVARPPIAYDPVVYMPVRSPLLYPYAGATNTVLQPPPSTGVSTIVPLTTTPPISPQPSPTVAVGAQQTALSLTQPGTTLDSSGASVAVAPSGITAWLAESTLIAGIPNWGIAAGAAVVAYMLLGGKAGRR